jgi:Arc/MetJ family transcription regulator
MRTNIDIEDDLMAKAMIATGKHTKRETVEAALKIAVRLKDQEGLRTLWGIGWDGDLEAMRLDK